MVDNPDGLIPSPPVDPLHGSIPSELPHTRQSEVFDESVPPTVEDIKDGGSSHVGIVGGLVHLMGKGMDKEEEVMPNKVRENYTAVNRSV